MGKEEFFEGQFVNFRVIRTISMPDEHEYFVLESPQGNRHLLRKAYYDKYNIVNGGILHCRIDKINCSGKIFMEPEHPVYKPGITYSFKVAGKYSHEYPRGILNIGLIVKDVFGNEIPIKYNGVAVSEADLPDSIECIVIRVKKSLPVLLPAGKSEEIEMNAVNVFTVNDIFISDNEEEFFVFENSKGQKHYLPVKDYQGFDFKPGMEVKCIIVDISADGTPVIEPVNPFYELDNSYDFLVSRWQTENDHYGEKRRILIVKDVLGKDARVYFDSDNSQEGITEGDILKCVVTRYKKGCLMLKRAAF